MDRRMVLLCDPSLPSLLKMFHAHFLIKPSNSIANDMIEDAPPPAQRTWPR